MALKVRVVNVTVRENIGNSMAHRFSDTQLSLRSAGRGIPLLMMARHCQNFRLCHRPRKRVTQYSVSENIRGYWMPRGRGA